MIGSANHGLAGRQAEGPAEGTWQFARLPRQPPYWRVTPTEHVPCLGRAVSSIPSTAPGPPTRASAFDQDLAQGSIVPGGTGEEAMELVMAAEAKLGSRGLQALAIAGAEQALQVDRRPLAPL